MARARSVGEEPYNLHTEHGTKWQVGDEVIILSTGKVCRVVGTQRDMSNRLLYCLARKRVKGEKPRDINEVDYYAEERSLKGTVEF